MRRFLLPLLLLALLIPATASAQGMKFGVVDFQKALNDVEEGKRARATLEQRFEEKRLGLEARKAELEQMQESLEAQKSLLFMSDSLPGGAWPAFLADESEESCNRGGCWPV